MGKRYDAVIIGGGHNGLVCAFYLARAGYRVRILERRAIVGGAAVTEEFHPGFRNSTASYTVSLLHPRIIRDMRLIDQGYKVIERPVSNFLPLPDDQYLILGGGIARTQAEFAKFSPRDADALPAYYASLETVANVIRDLVLTCPPNVGDGMTMMLDALRQGRHVAALTIEQQRDVLDLFTKSARCFLDSWFESDPVKAAFGFDAVVGNYASPDTPGSAYVLLHHVFGEVNGKKGAWGHVVGGMGSITQAMARVVQAMGVEVSLEAPVARVLVDGDKAVGVRLEGGEEVSVRSEESASDAGGSPGSRGRKRPQSAAPKVPEYRWNRADPKVGLQGYMKMSVDNLFRIVEEHRVPARRDLLPEALHHPPHLLTPDP